MATRKTVPGGPGIRVEGAEVTGKGSIPPDREEWASLYGAFVVLRKESHRVLSRWGLTVPKATVLALIAEAGSPLTVTRLARLLQHETPSISGLIERMCEARLVERLKDSADRRMTLVRLTEEGQHLHDSARASAAAVSEEMFGVLSKEDRAALKELLQRFQERNLERLR
jgi:DNA-binding MarR family transcriptional regulator